MESMAGNDHQNLDRISGDGASMLIYPRSPRGTDLLIAHPSESIFANLLQSLETTRIVPWAGHMCGSAQCLDEYQNFVHCVHGLAEPNRPAFKNAVSRMLQVCDLLVDCC